MPRPLIDEGPTDSLVVLADAPHQVGRVALSVRDLDRVANFYQSTMGLDVIEGESERLSLGTGGSVLLELRHHPDAEAQDRHGAGLFHTAFLLPTRADLGAWLAATAGRDRLLAGAADHGVSEAVYLRDPEGNGIEVYVDRPASDWVRRDGKIEMTSHPLDLNDLMTAAGPSRWNGFPDAGVIGHVHLQVGDSAEAEIFYGDALGLDVTWRSRGASFFGSGGYHHQVATNDWNSRGATVRRKGSAGLAEIEFLVSQKVLDDVKARRGRPGVGDQSTALTLYDPWGLHIRLSSKGSK